MLKNVENNDSHNASVRNIKLWKYNTRNASYPACNGIGLLGPYSVEATPHKKIVTKNHSEFTMI